MREVPQIIEDTGVSGDYYNEYSQYIGLFKQDIVTIRDGIRKTPIKKYRERFPAEEYGEVLNPANRKRVERLDKMAASDRLTENLFLGILNAVHLQIFDRELGKYDPFSNLS